MDAQLILDRLRRDLRRLDRPTRERLHKALGRHDRFVFKVEADRLKLQDLFAVGRLLGYSPNELFDYYDDGSQRASKDGAYAYFKARGLRNGQRVSKNLSSFLSWVSDLVVEQSGSVMPLDLEAHLQVVGFELPTVDSLKFAELMFAFYAKHGPETLNPVSGRELIGSMILAVGSLRDLGRLNTACELLAHSFELEAQIHDLQLRSRLYELGASLCRGLERIWCLRRAAAVALLIPDFEYAKALSREAQTVAEELGVQNPADCWGHPPESAKADADRDLDFLLQIMLSDRSVASISAGALDQQLGAQKAFTMAVKRRAPMTLGRWARFVKALDLSHRFQLRRLEQIALCFPSPIPWIQSLFKGSEPVGCEALWQTKILEWVQEVEIVGPAPGLQIFDHPCWTTKSEQAFAEISAACESLASDRPQQLSPNDAVLLHGGLLLCSQMMREGDSPRLAAHFLVGSFRLADRLGEHLETSQLSWSYRTAVWLAVQAGEVDLAAFLLERAKLIDLKAWNPQGLILTHYLEGFLSRIVGQFEKSVLLHEICVKSIEDGLVQLPIEAILVSQARSCLLAGDLKGARNLIETVEPQIKPADSCEAEFLWIKAQALSMSGEPSVPIALLDRASNILSEGGRTIDFVLVEIEKCRHSLRFGERRKAEQQAISLLATASELKQNPVGQAAIYQLCRDVISGTWRLDSIETIMHRVQHPNIEELRPA